MVIWTVDDVKEREIFLCACIKENLLDVLFYISILNTKPFKTFSLIFLPVLKKICTREKMASRQVDEFKRQNVEMF